MKHVMAICILILIMGCGSNTTPADPVIFRSSGGDVISLTRDAAIIRGQSYLGRDCSNESMYCLDYSGYFSIIAPKKCKDIHGKLWRVGGLSATNLGVDHHRSRTMYGVNRGEMIAYDYSWDGNGVVGLAYDSKHQVGNSNALHAMGYRDPSIFYEKVNEAEFLACEKSEIRKPGRR